MQEANPRFFFFLLVVVLALPLSDGSSSSSNPSQYPDITAFTFQSHGVEAPEDARREDPYIDSQSADSLQSDQDESSVVSSSLFDGGCIVSAEAIMCTGGEAFFEFHPRDLLDEDEDEESDDDDDDDNDGHSSMLSNASLRRAKVGAGGYHQRQPRQSEASQSSEATVDVVTSTLPAGSTRSPSSIAFVARQKQHRLFGVH